MTPTWTCVRTSWIPSNRCSEEAPSRVGPQAACSLLSRDYSIAFRMIAIQSQWTDLSLAPVFYHGIQDVIEDKLIHRSWENDLNRLIKLACDIEESQRECDLECRNRRDIPQAPRHWMSLSCYAPVLQEDEPEAMQVGRSRLSTDKRARCFHKDRCLYCSQPRHIIRTCPVRPPRPSREDSMPIGLRGCADGPSAG